ncbi:SDR family NAD(P)-dependent oxidoreductase, partial [Planktomarina temperata]|nr:SDR family NAD(P)-dependent oxidoreductase [Planktomarina temperata]
MRSASLFNVEGKIAVVTGASSGLGQGAASLLAAHGALVIAIARRADALAAWSEQTPGETAVLAADLSDRS